MNLLIIHGYKLSRKGNKSLVLQSRLDTALKWVKNHPETNTVVVSGGGKGLMNESSFMEQYLRSHGVTIPIVKEASSINTIQNVINCRRIFKDIPIKHVCVVVGQNMLKRTQKIYLHRWPEIHTNTKWLPVPDGYKGYLEFLWNFFT